MDEVGVPREAYAEEGGRRGIVGGLVGAPDAVLPEVNHLSHSQAIRRSLGGGGAAGGVVGALDAVLPEADHPVKWLSG